jgi:hypothetical protein
MARALECPACGARHRLDSLSGGSTFRCDRCGQVLKVPPSVGATRPSTARADPPAPSESTSATSAAPVPPPRRGGSAAARGQTVSATAGSVAGTGATSVSATSPSADDDASSRRSRRAARAPRKKVRLYWRVVAWIVAVPLGFVITAWPAYQLDLIKKNDLLDVFVGEGTGRYVRLLVGAAIWALVTALLVQLFVEGGRWFANRRRERKSRAGGNDRSPRQPQPVAGSAPRPPARSESV